MHDILGTWRLAALSAENAAGSPLPQPYGPKPMGLLTFNAVGRMMAVLCDGRTEVPGGGRAYTSYCGNYRFDGETLVTRVDAASQAERLGTEQVRQVRFDADGRMVLRPPLRSYGQVAQQRAATWERVG